VAWNREFQHASKQTSAFNLAAVVGQDEQLIELAFETEEVKSLPKVGEM
jgi:hypothetical protein